MLVDGIRYIRWIHISKNTGGLATYFAKVWASKTYMQLREGSKKVLSKIPPAWEWAQRTELHDQVLN